MDNYDVTIGLEVHAQLATKTKMWCHCEVTPSALENTKVCPICSAQPGTLPVPNQQAVNFAIKMALATGCDINKVSYFDRKNYFYPDLPKGYQITQFEVPIAENGVIELDDESGKSKQVRIQRIQIEEDTGKSTHEGESSLINLNRCGTPLIEIVSMPDMTGPKEASQYLKKLHSILTYIDVSHGNLQEGNFRCDVNVSIRKKGEEKLGTRTETKNLNSFKSVEKVIELEVQRQIKTLEAGEKVVQETLNFDPLTGKITPMRSKSDAHDYRYFPEPDLLPLVLTDQHIQKVRETLPELGHVKQKRFIETYDIPEYDAGVLTADKKLANYFEEATAAYKGTPKKMSNWIMVELLRLLNEAGTPVEKSPVLPKELANLLNAVDSGTISGKIAKEVFEKMYDTSKGAEEIIQSMGVSQINDDSLIEDIAKKVIDSNPKQVEQYLGGKDKLFGFFVGQVMKESKGQANPQKTNEILKKLFSDKK